MFLQLQEKSLGIQNKHVLSLFAHSEQRFNRPYAVQDRRRIFWANHEEERWLKEPFIKTFPRGGNANKRGSLQLAIAATKTD